MTPNGKPTAVSSTEFAKQAEKLSLQRSDSPLKEIRDTTAVEARFITPQDPVIETANGKRLPTVPLKEALKLNELREKAGYQAPSVRPHTDLSAVEKSLNSQQNGFPSSQKSQPDGASEQNSSPEAAFRTAIPPQRTHPLFPDLPLYGPPSLARDIQCIAFRISSYFLSLSFLMVIVLGSAFTSIPMIFRHLGMRLRLKDPNSSRPFHEEEKRRQATRERQAREWKHKKRRKSNALSLQEPNSHTDYTPLEGGPDLLICDVGYYARRVGLECEDYAVQTEDGFIISLLHIYDAREQKAASAHHRDHQAPICFPKYFDEVSVRPEISPPPDNTLNHRYPVLLLHGLLQSAGAYCANDDDSLAFFLAKSGFDVWLGNNRCGFQPRHTLLKPSDPRMWNWNIRQMGVMDLSALVSRVLAETGFEKLGLVCHSQGTTQTFVALAKGQRPDLGGKISVFCALAPAVYAGPLIGKMYFKFMRIISPGMFRVMFGIHSFIPFMMTMHCLLPGRFYGALGYRVFSFLFNWTDTRWDIGLRDRFFQFSPVYVSAESMRWWLGRECFASQKCILATRSESRKEDEEDQEEGQEEYFEHGAETAGEQALGNDGNNGNVKNGEATKQERGERAWYDEQVPPFALWVAGSDQLVDGRRLLRRFKRGREPYVKVVHSKVIDEYEHLDVLWAINALEKVGKEVREVIWRSVSAEERKKCRVPRGCEGAEPFE